MSDHIQVIKHSGEKEPFDPEKLHQSLIRSGATEKLAKKVERELAADLKDGISTAALYKRAFQILRRIQRPAAARYSLKKAIMELGPSGYPFEQFVGELLRHMGYDVEVGQVVKGQCISHEVDVVAHNDHQQFMVECKYYNSQGKYCNVRVPLYIDSRFRDIRKRWKSTPGIEKKSFHGWVITNTRFTNDAVDYGKCAGLRMLSWDYPKKEGLKDMIEKAGLFPVTTLTQLNRKQKQYLLDNKIVLCRQLLDKPGILEQIDLSRPKREKVIDEARELTGSA